jgi:hypothetical protein
MRTTTKYPFLPTHEGAITMRVSGLHQQSQVHLANNFMLHLLSRLTRLGLSMWYNFRMNAGSQALYFRFVDNIGLNVYSTATVPCSEYQSGNASPKASYHILLLFIVL